MRSEVKIWRCGIIVGKKDTIWKLSLWAERFQNNLNCKSFANCLKSARLTLKDLKDSSPKEIRYLQRKPESENKSTDQSASTLIPLHCSKGENGGEGDFCPKHCELNFWKSWRERETLYQWQPSRYHSGQVEWSSYTDQFQIFRWNPIYFVKNYNLVLLASSRLVAKLLFNGNLLLHLYLYTISKQKYNRPIHAWDRKAGLLWSK